MASVSAGKLRGWHHWVLGLLALACFLVPLKFEVAMEFWERFLDFLHVPAFAAIALYLHHFLPAKWSPARRLGWAFGLAAAASGMVEILQHWTGRQASFWDFYYSVSGAFLSVLWLLLWPRGFGSRVAWVLYTALICAATGLPAWHQWQCLAWREMNFPMISDFEDLEEFRLWREWRPFDAGWGFSIVPSTRYVTHGRQSARVILRGSQNGTMRIFLVNQDWRPYQAFAFDLFNPGEPFELSMRVDDDGPILPPPNRFYRALPIEHGWNHIRIPLEEAKHPAKGRPLNLAAMRRIVFFRYEPKVDVCVFYLDWLRVE